MKTIRITTILLLLIISINALWAGYSFMTDSTGGGLQISTTKLQFSPFRNFFIPGLILVSFIGLLSLLAAVFTIFRFKYHTRLIIYQSVILIGWITVQMIMLREINFLHILLLILGAMLFVFGNRLNV